MARAGRLFYRALLKGKAKEAPLPLDALPLLTFREPQHAPAGREVCLLVGYAPDGRVSPCAASLLNAFSSEGLDCYLCLAVDDIGAPLHEEGLGAAKAIFLRQNGGYDFAIWASVLAAQPDIWDASRIVFANDSVIGPFPGFEHMMRRLRASEADFVALTESFEHRYHTQSYFFSFQNEALQNQRLREFWRKVRVFPRKKDVIANYELGLSSWVNESCSLKTEVLFSFSELFPHADISEPIICNPTHVLWETLLMRGFPFVKAELLHSNPFRLPLVHWKIALQAQGADLKLVEAQLRQMERMRGPAYVFQNPSQVSGLSWQKARRLFDLGIKFYLR